MAVRRGSRLVARILGSSGVLALLLGGCAEVHPQSIFRPTSQYAVVLNSLFANTFWWTMFVLAVVWGVLIVVIFRFREKPNTPRPKPVHGNTKLEVLWTLAPAVIVVFIAVPTVRTIFQTQRPAPPNALVVEVIGHQWWWEFRYPQYGNIATANEVHLIQGRPVDFVMHSADVIHSFWIPRLGGKRDVIPQPQPVGNMQKRVNHIVLTPDSLGVFPGQCAEYCGASHADMRVHAIVQTAPQFTAWLRAYDTPPQPAPGTMAAQGKQIFETHLCIACHTVNGTTARGVLGPNLTLVGSRQTIGAGMLPTSVASFRKWITNPRDVKPGVKMPGIRQGAAGMPPTGLTDQQVEAVATYLYSLKPAAPAVTPAPAAPAATAPATAPAATTPPRTPTALLREAPGERTDPRAAGGGAGTVVRPAMAGAPQAASSARTPVSPAEGAVPARGTPEAVSSLRQGAAQTTAATLAALGSPTTRGSR